MSTTDAPAPDLGNLAILQPGSEVVSVFVDSAGAVTLGRTCFVSSVEPARIRTRRAGSPHYVGAYAPGTGRTLAHLYGPVAYLSANPAHIAQAKESEAAERALTEAREAALKARMLQARPIADELADDEAVIVVNVLANRLDSQQLTTLAGWLGVS
jgi:hypothetical protein